MLVVLSVLLKGKLVVSPQLLRTCTGGNEKTYTQEENKFKIINLLITYINIGGILYIYKKWSRFIYYHVKIVNQSGLSLSKKIRLYPTLLKKITLFYYDIICVNVRLRGYDIFSKIRRKNHLN